jgi:hypothetical protein
MTRCNLKKSAIALEVVKNLKSLRNQLNVAILNRLWQFSTVKAKHSKDRHITNDLGLLYQSRGVGAKTESQLSHHWGVRRGKEGSEI